MDDERKKGKELREAYQIALDPADWEQKQLQAEAERAKYLQDLEEAAKNVEEDELVEEDEAGEGSKKRKRKSEAKPKEAKKRKAETESKKVSCCCSVVLSGGPEVDLDPFLHRCSQRRRPKKLAPAAKRSLALLKSGLGDRSCKGRS